MFLMMRLKTEIDNKEIRMSFFPLVKKRIIWNKIKSREVLNYGFVGGWGIRMLTKYGIVYNARGNQGLYLVFNNGNKMILGTQNPEGLIKFLEKENL